MNNKFTMELVWHNCKTHPPEEDYNPKLFITDGADVFVISYWSRKGFYDEYVGRSIPSDVLHLYWWADIRQTVKCEPRFVNWNFKE